MKLQQLIPTRAAIAHLRFVFSLFLFPVFLFALSQTAQVHVGQALLIFFIWHFLAFPASNGYNSYFDRDEQSIALLEKPPEVDISLYYFSLLMEVLAFGLGLIISWQFAVAVLVYGIMSKLYSHPATRLKKHPIISFLTVFLFQGAFIYWSTVLALMHGINFERDTTGLHLFIPWNTHFFIAGAICSCLIGASYPLTQIYQHEEDSRRGDRTLSLMLGYKGSFMFSGALFAIGLALTYLYWQPTGNLINFYLFVLGTSPIFIFFNKWFYKVSQNPRNANFKNAMRMNFISAGCMVLYFGWLVLTK